MGRGGFTVGRTFVTNYQDDLDSPWQITTCTMAARYPSLPDVEVLLGERERAEEEGDVLIHSALLESLSLF